MSDVTLSDGTVTLSPLRADDVGPHLAGEDALLVRWLSGAPSTREGAEAYFRHCREQWATAGPLRAFGIRTAGGPDGGPVLAGTIDVRFSAAGLDPGQVNVAYGLYPSWRGRGLATRAVLLLLPYVAREGGREAVIKVDPGNPASAAVARRAGFTPAGRAHDPDGVLYDRYVRDPHATG
ncbi:GNAT family N-acetyltransferase [Streptomyces termitum]|uniref:N-acetyltransferase domain-containing protein n=1 Tax=Streptomyces termitum TaxID=67368 RepID=A0A918T8S1_9ACTN|nr:GNAT family N-acetyltransferase [Streptomyces termitum]GHA92040.1 hypothetical protein GCM10010305_39620 [Streptomyces termitum]